MKRSQFALLLVAGLLLCGLAALLFHRGGERARVAAPGAQDVATAEGQRKAADLVDVVDRAPRPHANGISDGLAPEEIDAKRVRAEIATVSVRYEVYTEPEDERIAIGDAEVRWTLSDGDEVVYAQGITRADANGLGEFEIEVPAGMESLSLDLYGKKQGWIQENDCEVDAWDIASLKEHLEERMELYLDRGTWLKGVVYGPDGELCEQGGVLATQLTDDPDDAEAIDGSIEEGHFTLPIYVEGLWNLSVTAEDVGSALIENIVISMERDPSPLEVHLRGGGILAGVVLGADKKPLRGVEIHAVLASALEADGLELDSVQAFHLSRSKPKPGAFGARRAKRVSGKDGKFEISGLEPGRYALACLQSAGDRYAGSEVVLAETNGAPIELSIGLCRLTVRVEVSPGPPGLDYDANLLPIEIQCRRFDPRREGPKGLGSSQFEVHPISTGPRDSVFLVIPGHLYEVRASPTDPAFNQPVFGFIGSFFEPIVSDSESKPKLWIGMEVKRQVAIPKGRGSQQLDLVLPAPEAPGFLQCEAAGAASELLITWSLSLFADAEDLVTNDELWKRTTSSHEMPFTLSLQPGRYRLRTHSSHVQGSPHLFESNPLLGDGSMSHTLSGFTLGTGFSLFRDNGVETWIGFEIRSGQTHSVALEHLEGGTLEIGLDVHLNGAEEALDLGNEGQDLVQMWQAKRLVRDARGEWRHIGLTAIDQPEGAAKATTWYRCDNRLAPGTWTVRLELGTFGTLEADFVVRAGETTRLPLRADLE